MFTPQQYRAKAAEYTELIKTAGSADEEREFRKLESSFLALATNTQWMADNHDKTLHPVQEASASTNWNDEGGAPQAPRR
ncbi:MAG: hypothetical protein K8F62_11675 [Pseudorhodoplanes sp.]|nr:hypothetical protein [Pseudorhodoplanes sp.]